jgi:NADPH-dependent curcumin reductase CurA
MRPNVNHKWVLARLPRNEVLPEDLKLTQEPIPIPGPGQFRARSIYLSIDPGTRQWMKGVVEDLGVAKPGDVIWGVTVGVVEESNHPKFQPGEMILGMYGWQNYAILTDAQKIKRGPLPLTANISVLGGTGATAYFGITELGKPKPSETVLVSGAAGATGSVAGQVAKLNGCRVVGIAGSDEKCRHVVERYGFDACINYKKEDMSAALRRECPNRIDVVFENVGGELLEAALGHLNLHARVILCGLISAYNRPPRAPDPASYGQILVQRVTVYGYCVLDYFDRFSDFEREMTQWVTAGKVKYDVQILRGIEKSAEALQAIFAGHNIGKVIVQTDEE